MSIHRFILALALSPAAWCAATSGFCQPPPEMERAFEKAAAASGAVTDPFAAWDRVAPFLAIRDQYPDNLFAHERYQDAVHDYGIEGHLQLLAKQYAEFESRHTDDLMFHYLRLRATVGRATPAAIQGLSELLAKNPNFAPAHRTLAEIYSTEAFHQPELENIEKKKFLDQCPTGAFTRRPPPVPAPSTLIDAAARLLDKSGDPDRIVAMTTQGLKEFEWRSQRIRAFDWYSRDSKIQDARELRSRYWQAWPIQVRAYRQAGRLQEARQVLATMEQRATPLRFQPGAVYWDALELLAQLYAESGQTERAGVKIQELRRIVADTQDAAQRSARSTRLEQLEAVINRAGEASRAANQE